MEDFISIARILKTRGIRGEVAAEVLTDFPERFEGLRRVRVWQDGQFDWEEIEGYWFHGSRIILKFRGRDNPEQAAPLVGAEVQIPAQDRLPLPPGCYYHSDLIGCRVWSREGEIGVVSSLLETGGEGVNLVVTLPSGEELMIPLARAFVKKVRVDQKRIQVELPAAMWELRHREKRAGSSRKRSLDSK